MLCALRAAAYVVAAVLGWKIGDWLRAAWRRA
jgi:hypothetical protein